MNFYGILTDQNNLTASEHLPI